MFGVVEVQIATVFGHDRARLCRATVTLVGIGCPGLGLAARDHLPELLPGDAIIRACHANAGVETGNAAGQCGEPLVVLGMVEAVVRAAKLNHRADARIPIVEFAGTAWAEHLSDLGES